MTSAAPQPASDSRRFATILLVDDRGWVLLQERDEHAPLSPGQWGMVGGHVDPGEDHELAAYRELEEETGLRMPLGSLRLWREEEFRYPDGYGGDYRVYVGRVALTDADIVVGEGRQIVFVDPRRVADLPLAASSRHFVVAFVADPIHTALRAEPPTAPLATGVAD